MLTLFADSASLAVYLGAGPGLTLFTEWLSYQYLKKASVIFVGDKNLRVQVSFRDGMVEVDADRWEEIFGERLAESVRHRLIEGGFQPPGG